MNALRIVLAMLVAACLGFAAGNALAHGNTAAVEAWFVLLLAVFCFLPWMK